MKAGQQLHAALVTFDGLLQLQLIALQLAHNLLQFYQALFERLLCHYSSSIEFTLQFSAPSRIRTRISSPLSTPATLVNTPRGPYVME